MVAVSMSTEEALAEDPDPGVVEDAATWEIRAALRLTRRSAECHLMLAHDLVERLPRVWTMLGRGEIDLPRARVIIDQTRHLDEPTARLVTDQVAGQAASLTTGQLRARIARLVFSVDPESARERYEQGLADRRVTAEANDDGTADLYGLHLNPADANAAMRKINRLARAARSSGDDRTMDQLRADVFLDLLNGRNQHHARDRAVVDIQVDLTTLTGLDEQPGTIPGWGPVISDIARRVVTEQPESEWRVTVTGGEGEVVWNGTTRRRPTHTQRRNIETRNPTCVFPGCRMPADQCDIDHHRAWVDGGATLEPNLGPLCRHDHVGKHRGWKLEQTRPGTYQWTSPLGHVYTVGPDPP